MTFPSPGHPTKLVSYGNLSAGIDVKIADFVLALWQNGIQTSFSCQDRNGRAWIQLPAPDLARLRSILGESAHLVSSEYEGPASVVDERDHNMFFSLTDVPKLTSLLADQSRLFLVGTFSFGTPLFGATKYRRNRRGVGSIPTVYL